ncbi:MAG: D-alanine--D-alanine ligase [Bacteroidales bacterium]|nr:D-alanine--D-alanine ligase [Bacteroidales bacterium]
MRKNIALVTGGYSGELEISLKSANEVAKNLDKDKYKVFTIHIGLDDWTFHGKDDDIIVVDKNDFSIIYESKHITFDCAFIALHGTPGEDGRLQGYFDLIGLPYTSSGMTTSAITFNKYFSNKIVRSLGVKTADSVFMTADNLLGKDEIIQKIGLPCFVKPNNGGSSVGISRVDRPEEMLDAMRRAMKEDNEIVIERHIEGFELTCGLLKHQGEFIIFPLTEIISEKSFFDYEAKYTEGLATEITPARVSDDLEERCNNTSAFLYDEMNCKGFVRFDYIVSNDELYFLEVNTIPGMTAESIVPKQAQEMGLSLKELYSMVIEEAIS